jgi:hypothetical protein
MKLKLVQYINTQKNKEIILYVGTQKDFYQRIKDIYKTSID